MSTPKGITSTIINDPKTSNLSNDDLLIYMLLITVANEWGILQDAPSKLNDATGNRSPNMDATINKLVEADLLRPMKTQRGRQVLVVVNYGKYNPPLMPPTPAMDPAGFRERKRGGAQPPTTLVSAGKSQGPTFMDWYKLYPRKADRRAAERAWNSAVKRGEKPEAMLAALKQQLPELKEKERKFVKHPATWLNSGSYTNKSEVEEKPLSYWGKVAGNSKVLGL